jgi:Cu2+-containing amine oxidase
MRQGLILHHLTYNHRSILYRAVLSEMIVPDNDPAEQQIVLNLVVIVLVI